MHNDVQQQLDNALKARKMLEDTYQAQFKILASFVSRLSLACKGVDVDLDNRLAKLRTELNRGTDLEKDLKDRDFTINAIASRLDEPDKLLDPLAGSTDLFNGVLRTCSNTSIVDDPVRILRAIRLAAGYDLKILIPRIKDGGQAPA